MPLVPMAALLQRADLEEYAIGAFNINNLEFLQAVMTAAEAEGAPVIVQASQGALKYAGLESLVSLVRVAAGKSPVPVALNLDHGTDFAVIMSCIRGGFTSVMVDGSKLPYEENVALVRKVVEVAHAVGVSVEAELGRIMGVEEQVQVTAAEAAFTDPEEAARFVEATGVDALAVAVGTAHGIYQREPHLDLDRLASLEALVPVPLVLHGASGVPDDQIQAAIARGVRKINIDTDLRQAFVQGLREILAAKPDEIDPRKILGPARDKVEAVVRQKMRLFGTAGRAWNAGP